MEHWQEAVSKANQLVSNIESFRVPELKGYPQIAKDLQQALTRIKAKAITLQGRMTLESPGDAEPSDDEATLLMSQDREEQADRELKEIQEAERIQQLSFQNPGSSDQ